MQICLWEEDEDGVWDTSCENRHEFFNDGPRENKYRFCPYCGNTIQITYQDNSLDQ